MTNDIRNFADRDAAVRHNTYASVRRREGIGADVFAAYWRDVHAPLCSRLPGLGFYVQQHFRREGGANLWPVADGIRRITAQLDGSAELGFANLEDQARFGKAGVVLYADERNLFDEAIAYNLPRGSQTFVDQEEDGVRNGPDRLHRVHVYMTRRRDSGANAWLAETSAELARIPGVRKLKLHLPEPYDNAQPAPPSPGVGHTVDADRLDLAVAEVAFDTARAAREVFGGAAFRKIVADQPRYIEAIGAYLVSGFYTFVRDGKPTTAGLRGSRQAELIDAFGATNQLETAITGLFTRSG